MTDPDTLLDDALDAYRIGRARRCRELLEKAWELAPQRPDLAYRVALARIEDAAVEEGVLALEAALALDPGREWLATEFLAPVDALLTRRPTFKNLVKLKKQLAEGKPLKLSAREPKSPDPAGMPKSRR